MPKKPNRDNQQAEVNTFVGGLITEASPLNFPENFSREEENFVLKRDGTRSRRLGMDFEENYIKVDADISFVSSDQEDLGSSLFTWEGPGGDDELEFLVVQVGNTLHFYNTTEPFLSQDGALSIVYNVSSDVTSDYTYAVIDGRLVVGTTDQEVPIITYTSGVFQRDKHRVTSRDLWGVEDILGDDIAGIFGIPGLQSMVTFDDADNSIRYNTTGSDLTSILTNAHWTNLAVGTTVVITGTNNNNGTYVFASYSAVDAFDHKIFFDSGITDEVVQNFLDPHGVVQKPIEDIKLHTTVDGNRRDLNDSNNISFRPAQATDEHFYNLQNQGWAVERLASASDASSSTTQGLQSPIDASFNLVGVPFIPSNSDVVQSGIRVVLASGGDAEKGEREVFHPQALLSNPLGSQPAAKGHFIIDALSRGSGRISAYTPHTYGTSVELISDITTKGFRVVAQYSGRVFYAGANNPGGPLETGDTSSPALENYVFFSQAVTRPANITKCYQEGDPTSTDENEVVASDGGFIKISGLSNVLKMIELDKTLVIFASNGIWAIRGEDNTGFSATSFELVKVSTYGVVSAKSIVEVGDQVFYWGEGGIYTLAVNQIGEQKATNIVEEKIQTLYNNIDILERAGSFGAYDDFDKKVRWLYKDSVGDQKELIFDLVLGAFSQHTIQEVDTPFVTPSIQGVFKTSPFTFGSRTDDIVVGADDIVVGANDVVVTSSVRSDGVRSLKYLAYTNSGTDPIEFTFALYRDQEFLDWKSVDTVGVDAKATLLTGDVTVGKSNLQKQMPYLTMYFNKTETGFEEDGFGDLEPSNPSSCKVRVRWDWANSIAGGKWSREFQAYRHKRPYFPTGTSDTFDNGFELVVTKNKIRGRGRAFSMALETEPGKDCQILGWTLSLNGNQYV